MKSRLNILAGKILIVLACLAAPQLVAAADDDPGRVHYSPVQYLKNFALSACIAEGYSDGEVKKDANAAAGGYLELGHFAFEAYEEAAALGKTFLAKQYRGKHGEKLTLMKCIDLFHSPELDRLAKKYSGK
jgi:hypothetical protein